MIYLCACGNFKSASPHHSAATKRWVCFRCRHSTIIYRGFLLTLLLRHKAHVVEMVDARDLKSGGLGRVGSSPTVSTNNRR